MADSPALPTLAGMVTLIDEPVYGFHSTDNARRYPQQWTSGEAHLNSVHGVLVDGEPAIVLGASGGSSGIHAHAAFTLDDRLYVAVGNHAVCLSVDPVRVEWARQVDFATCFGLYLTPDRGSLISHGELSIARVSLDGELLWQATGPDIFTGSIALMPDFVEAEDFNGDHFRFAYDDGALIGG